MNYPRRRPRWWQRDNRGILRVDKVGRAKDVGGSARSESGPKDADVDGVGGSRAGVKQHHADAAILPAGSVHVHDGLIGRGGDECVVRICEQMSHLCAVIGVGGDMAVVEYVVVQNLVIHIEGAVFNPAEVIVRRPQRDDDAGIGARAGLSDGESQSRGERRTYFVGHFSVDALDLGRNGGRLREDGGSAAVGIVMQDDEIDVVCAIGQDAQVPGCGGVGIGIDAGLLDENATLDGGVFRFHGVDEGDRVRAVCGR